MAKKVIKKTETTQLNIPKLCFWCETHIKEKQKYTELNGKPIHQETCYKQSVND